MFTITAEAAAMMDALENEKMTVDISLRYTPPE